MSSTSSNEQELLAIHRQELKELQSKIQSLKHGVSKGDKKKKKQVAVEVALLEAELNERQDKELADLLNHKNGDLSRDSIISGSPATPGNEIADPVENSTPGVSADAVEDVAPQRVSKAQKRKNKKAAQAKEREEAIVQQEVDNLSGARHLEREKLNLILSERGLAVHEVPSDGDCLYKAVEHQLSMLSLQDTSVEKLRRETCDYMLSHKEDFHPFLTDAATGDLMSDDQYEKYCQDIASKPTWGGHVEIQALSHVCKSPIEVIQADGPSVIAGENFEQKQLILTYHRHMYGLGEHYNSVKIPEMSLDDAI